MGVAVASGLPAVSGDVASASAVEALPLLSVVVPVAAAAVAGEVTLLPAFEALGRALTPPVGGESCGAGNPVMHLPSLITFMHRGRNTFFY